MSTIKWFPAALQGLQTTEGDGEVTFDTDGSIFITRVWAGAFQSCLDLCPKPRDFPPPNTPGLNVRCIESSVKRLRPDAGQVTARYQGIWNMPFTTYQMEASRYEKPIIYHPKFNDASVFGVPVGNPNNETGNPLQTKFYDVQKINNVDYPYFKAFANLTKAGSAVSTKFAGIEAYMVATATFRKTSYALSPDFGLANIFKLNAPETGGSSVPDASNASKSWLKADKTCRNLYRGASQIWEIQESWLYNANGWLEAIYS
jgi:hypothetical protein